MVFGFLNDIGKEIDKGIKGVRRGIEKDIFDNIGKSVGLGNIGTNIGRTIDDTADILPFGGMIGIGNKSFAEKNPANMFKNIPLLGGVFTQAGIIQGAGNEAKNNIEMIKMFGRTSTGTKYNQEEEMENDIDPRLIVGGVLLLIILLKK